MLRRRVWPEVTSSGTDRLAAASSQSFADASDLACLQGIDKQTQIKTYCPRQCASRSRLLGVLALPPCRQENKSATEQAPRHPPQPLEEALDTLSGKQPSDDGRVVTGKSKPAKDGSGGRFYFNFTGFPFPLGPLFARQTVRCEVAVSPCS